MFSGKIAVSLGFNCNFKCAHCANWFETRKKLSQVEKKHLISVINRYKIKTVHFIGGEPFLYIEDINEIVGSIRERDALKVIVTTNGGFANSKKAAVSALKSIVGLTKIQLSYDKFHARFLPFTKAENLYQACCAVGLEFGVLSAIETPMDMLLINKLHELGKFPILVQKVLPQGGGAVNEVAYKAYTHFEKKVLARRCPERKDLLYMCGKGFSICCSALTLSLKLKGIVHKTPEALFNSRLYKLMQRHSFRELLALSGLSAAELRPEHSSVCNLCEHIFKNMPPAGKLK